MPSPRFRLRKAPFLRGVPLTAGKRLLRGTLRGLAASGMILAYLLASTQLAFPIHEWIEAAAESPVKTQAFACSIHKCACQNALQCRVKCCCFPKASAPHAHENGDGMTAHWAVCGGAPGEHGPLPPLPAHAPAVPERPSGPVIVGAWFPAPLPDPLLPYPEALLKVPISLLS
jgi:hypothetical protein